MSKKGDNIYLRSDGRWEGRFPIGKRKNGGKKFFSVYGETREEAKAKKVEIKKAYEKEFIKKHRFVGDLPNRKNATTKVYTFSEWCIYFLEADKERRERKKWTHQRYKMLIENHLVPEFGNLPITLITPERVNKFIKMLIESYEKEKAKEIFLLFNGLMWKAKRAKFIRYNPYYYAWRPNKEEFFAHFTIANLLEESPESDGFQLKAALCINQETKLQMSKLLSLEWKDIDFENRLIELNTSYQNVVSEVVEHTSIRKLPIPEMTYQVLQELKKSAKNELVFRRDRILWTEPRISDTYVELGYKKVLPMWPFLNNKKGNVPKSY
ncbi:tyrosine-type recombinase/integrase [Enterococcus sp. AZ163]|uniref:tyrosine-type recombinase/integrase n=1 Tax=Enterococcus sp. AZ163 TaxID=2774638 RepID=UPI003D2D5E63